MNDGKVGKLPIIASYTCNLISKSLQGGKNMCFLLICTKTSTDCFVLEDAVVYRFQTRICIISIITSGEGK